MVMKIKTCNLLTFWDKEKDTLSVSVQEKKVDRSPAAPYKMKVSYLGVTLLYCTPLYIWVPSEPRCITPWRFGLRAQTQDVALASAFSECDNLYL